MPTPPTRHQPQLMPPSPQHPSRPRAPLVARLDPRASAKKAWAPLLLMGRRWHTESSRNWDNTEAAEEEEGALEMPIETRLCSRGTPATTTGRPFRPACVRVRGLAQRLRFVDHNSDPPQWWIYCFISPSASEWQVDQVSRSQPGTRRNVAPHATTY